VIKYGEMPIPELKAGEVLVKIHASGVNPSDTKTREGWGGIPMSFSRVIPHNDGAGVIEGVGEGVNNARMGERVWLYETQQGRPFGTSAQYTVINANYAVFLPENTSFAEGACLGVPAMTAHRAVFADGEVKEQNVLVTGGAGAVGNYAIALAKWGGAKVFTTVSRPEQAEVAKIAGADEIINYKTEDVVQRIEEITGEKRSIDRIVDVNFTANLPITSAVLKPNGVIVSYSSANPDDRPELPFLSMQLLNTTIRLILVYTMLNEAKQKATEDITTALKAGALHHNIARRFALTEVAQAHEAQDSGAMIGKAIIEIVKYK
ncbi:MAG: NADPH:quinone reductase, partial [Waterburya sp.]